MTKASPAAKPRAWQRMLSGRRLDLLDPSPLDIEIEDIAHGLARVARWNGQTHGDYAFSVAQHSVLVLDLAVSRRPSLGAAGQLAALLHDSPEYVIGDLISPFKAAVGLDYKAFEKRLLGAIHLRFGLEPDVSDPLAKLIKQADRAAAFFEATRLAGFSVEEAHRFFGKPRTPPSVSLDPLPAHKAEAQFLDYFDRVAAGRGLGAARRRARSAAGD